MIKTPGWMVFIFGTAITVSVHLPVYLTTCFTTCISASAQADEYLSSADPLSLPPAPASAVGYPSNAPDLDVRAGFITPPPGYGEVPFWWWTGQPLDKERLSWQIEQLSKKGISGMQVNYAHKDTPGWPTFLNSPEIFTDQWWDFYSHASAEAKKHNMGIGLSTYTLDWNKSENLFNRIIYNEPEFNARSFKGRTAANIKKGAKITLTASENSLGFWSYPVQNGQMVLEPTPIPLPETTEEDGPAKIDFTAPDDVTIWEFYWTRESGTLNPLHPGSGQRVIDRFFQPFEDHNAGRNADGLNYFFNDELHIGIGGYQWYDDFPEQFRKIKGYDLFSLAPAMFNQNFDQTPKVRMDYMDVQIHLSELRYFKPIYLWHYSRGMTYGCDNNGRGLSPTEYGDYFRTIRWYSAPGHDTPGGHADFTKDKVSSSIANLYKRPRVWLEGYHSLGWGANPNQLMTATNENYVYGATLLNLHGLYYTTFGSYWEWAPPCYHFRMPYWEHMGTFLKYFERLSYVLSQGVWQSEIAVMYPTVPAAAGLNSNQGEATRTAFDAAKRIYSTGRDVTFIDDQSVLRAKIERNPRSGKPQLCVSDMRFSVYVLPSVEAIRWDVLCKLRQFQEAGGTVVCIGKRPVVSDRAGANDPVLNELVEKMFPTVSDDSQNEQASTTDPAVDSVPPRTYPGGFSGYWAWAKETNRKSMTVVGTLDKLDTVAKQYRVRFNCDNHGDLYINDKLVCQNADYSTGWEGSLELKKTDTVRIEGRDDDEGNKTAGVFFAVSDGKKTLVTTTDLKYRVNDKLFALDPTNTHDLHRFGRAGVTGRGTAVEDSQWREFDQQLASFPVDVFGSRPVKYLHRRAGGFEVYMVMGAENGKELTFRSGGRVELWDAFTGKAKPMTVTRTEKKDGFDYTTVLMPVEANQAVLVVFDSHLPQQEATEASVITNADQTPALPGQIQKNLDGQWKFRLIPTMDNRFGDFRLPVTDDNRIIGLEARKFSFRYASEQEIKQLETATPGQAVQPQGWKWTAITHGFGQQFQIASVPASETINNNGAGIPADRWQPYNFSWRLGVEGNPGHQGWHGLKENINDNFIALGQVKGGHNENVFTAENPPKRYYLKTTVQYAGKVTIQQGGNLPDRVWLDGKIIDPQTRTLDLNGQTQTLVLSYPQAGRGYWFFEKGNQPERKPQVEAADLPAGQCTKTGLTNPTPLAMTWFDLDYVPFNPQAQPSSHAVYRFVTSPGLKAMTITVTGDVPVVLVNGRRQKVTVTRPDAQLRATNRCRVELSEPITNGNATVDIIAANTAGLDGGLYIPEPVKIETVEGVIDSLFDWSRPGTTLETYSGGAVYTKTFTVDESESKASAAILDLGQLCATAEVRLNGQSVAILVATPWKADLTGLLRPGENTLEIEVYNTLSNHYKTIPTRYGGPDNVSGLVGPVSLNITTAGQK